MKIRLSVDGQVVTATLYDNATARDFAALLPLSLTLEDYAVIERISDLPRKLATADAPAGMTPEPGDITYYAPWGNLAIFVNGRAYARGLLPVGKVDTGLPALERSGPLKVMIERIAN
ncbi:cyclophilin-like fold protein [Cupriavidus basilensis]|uniref:cyclophilin-like fold protein n=1 Tax=Cupriavidus basilensis TaxID=68895 RepID=UPI0039F6AE72